MKLCKTCNTEIPPTKQKTALFCSVKCRTSFSNRRSTWRINNQSRGIERKLLLIDLLGGSCNKCGYNKNLAALAFHHKDPASKSYSLGLDSIFNRSLDSLKEEVSKCELLCHNCHAEHHNPRFNTTNFA